MKEEESANEGIKIIKAGISIAFESKLEELVSATCLNDFKFIEE